MRYPKLYEMATAPNPGIPDGNIVTKNALYNTEASNIEPSVIKYGTVSENNILSKRDYSMLKAYLYSGESNIVGPPTKGFDTIPISTASLLAHAHGEVIKIICIAIMINKFYVL